GSTVPPTQDREGSGRLTGQEMLALLEDRVVGQEKLAVHVHQQAAFVVGRTVVDVQAVCLSLGKPEQHTRAPGCLGQLRHPFVIRGNRDILLEVPDRVTAERELGENHQVATFADRMGNHPLGMREVGLELAGPRVDLCEHDAHRFLPDSGGGDENALNISIIGGSPPVRAQRLSRRQVPMKPCSCSHARATSRGSFPSWETCLFSVIMTSLVSLAAIGLNTLAMSGLRSKASLRRLRAALNFGKKLRSSVSTVSPRARIRPSVVNTSPKLHGLPLA